MKWNFITIVLLAIGSPMLCNAECKLSSHEKNLVCQNTTFEEYKNFILNEVKQPIQSITFKKSTITSLNNTFFEFNQVKDVEYFETAYCSVEKIEAFTFSNLKKLKYMTFTDNKVPLEISPNALQGLESLDYLEVADCKISHIETGTFAGLPKLKKIDLTYNNITTLKADTFIGATSLIELWLTESQISNIEPNAFNDLDNLVRLGLERNKLKTLPLGLFKNLKNILYLFLNNNMLDSLNFEALEGLSSLERIVIADNNIKVLDVTDVHKYTPNLKEIEIE